MKTKAVKKTGPLASLIKKDKEYLYQNYGDRLPVCFVKGDREFLYDQDGKKYIDFFSGIAVSNLGYNNKVLNAALHGQINKIIHSSNWFFNKEQIDAAVLISEMSFPGKTLFVNSGTEANEAAIKLARRYGLSIHKKKFQIATFSNSFHGRTFGSMTATAQKKIHDGFGPLPEGFKYLPFNDIKPLEKEIRKNKNLCAVMIELVQGEAGIKIADEKFVREAYDLCVKNHILFIVDEVQTGIGRTGNVFAYQKYGITPDIITLAKGLGGGVPVGALHTKTFLSEFFPRGVHGTTFGGNHLACAAACAVLNEIKKPALLKNVVSLEKYILNRLAVLKEKAPIIKEVRGIGLHIGIELKKPGMDIVKKALENGLVINCTADNVIRIMPPLNIRLDSIKKGLDLFEKILTEAGKQQ